MTDEQFAQLVSVLREIAVNTKPPKKIAKPKPEEVTIEQLTAAEKTVAEAITSDQSLIKIVSNPFALAQDLCSIAEPGVNVAIEVRKAGAWIRAKNAVYRNGNRFLVAWLGKCSPRRTDFPGKPQAQPQRTNSQAFKVLNPSIPKATAVSIAEVKAMFDE